MARLEGFVGAAEWIFTAVLAALTGAVGDLYRRHIHHAERLARSEGSMPEILKRIESKLDDHIKAEETKLDLILAATVKQGGSNG